ncbi:hypothetical protein PENSPDRAFT_749310 [Peniophora sp. CONT]|nr:hypothetical protein PENSPDRAFT_749310 [Peniophora sp. CONT]
MAGANYMGGKRNSARTRSKDSRGRAEKHHFGRKRVELLQQSLAAPQTAILLAPDRASQHIEQPIELNHASRDKSGPAKNAHESYAPYGSGGTGQNSGLKTSSRVIAAMDSDPTSVSYRSAVSDILRISRTTGLTALRGRVKPRVAPPGRGKVDSRSSPFMYPGNRLSETAGLSTHRSPPGKLHDSGFDAGSDVDDDVEPTPFAFDAGAASQDEGYADSSIASSSHAGSGRDLQDIEDEMQARYAHQLGGKNSQPECDRPSAPGSLGLVTNAGARGLGITYKSPPPLRHSSQSPTHSSQEHRIFSDSYSVQPSRGIRPVALLHVGDLLEEPDAWDATGKALGFASSQQSDSFAQPATDHTIHDSIRLGVGLATNSTPPKKVLTIGDTEAHIASAIVNEQDDELDMEIDWDILDTEDVASARDNADIDESATIDQESEYASVTGAPHDELMDTAGPLSPSGIDLDALFPEDINTYADTAPSTERLTLAALQREIVLPPATHSGTASLITPPSFQLDLKHRTHASTSPKQLLKPLSVLRPAHPMTNSRPPLGRSALLKDSLPSHNLLSSHSNAFEKRLPTSEISTTKASHPDVFTPLPISTPRGAARSSQRQSSPLVEPDPERGSVPDQPTPADDFLDSLFDDVMPNVQHESPAARPSRPSAAFELF